MLDVIKCEQNVNCNLLQWWQLPVSMYRESHLTSRRRDMAMQCSASRTVSVKRCTESRAGNVGRHVAAPSSTTAASAAEAV